MELTRVFENSPAERFRLKNCRNGFYQIIAPIFHEDGDMMNIYMQGDDNGNIQLSDQGMTLMRLSYLFDVDSDNKRKILNDIVSARGAENDQGNLTLSLPKEDIFAGIMSFSQMVSQVDNMHILAHENVSSLFYENIFGIISEFKLAVPCQKDYVNPLLPNIPIDYAFLGPNKPVYIFAVKDTHKANQATICCLQLKRNSIPCRNIVVFDDMDVVTRFAKYHIIDIANKTFSSLAGFKESGSQYIEEELAS